MGGGFELCLACHHRVASDNPRTRLGLPEVKVGLFPGAGGTQRVARMLPTADALQFLLKGDQLKTDRAKAMKLVDNVVPPADLIKAAPFRDGAPSEHRLIISRSAGVRILPWAPISVVISVTAIRS